jgi:hypothetical protein
MREGLRLRSLGEAHCFVAIVKADGEVTRRERARAGYHASRSQRKFSLFKDNEELARAVVDDISSILKDPAYSGWSADQHLDEAVTVLKRACEAGSRGVDITADKLEAELFELAYLDGYDFRESSFVKTAVSRLRELE